MNPQANTATAPVRVLVPPTLQPAPLAADSRVFRFGGRCMGTRWEVRVLGPNQQAVRALPGAAAALLEEIEAQMSHFRSDSPLRRFARLAAGESLALPTHFATVMRCALDVAQASDGAFDPCLAQAIEAWGFAAGPRYDAPGFVPPATSAARRSDAAHDWRALRLDADARLHQPGGVALNLSAIAKGYAVDALSQWLGEQGFAHHLVEVGGELRGAGVKPDLQPWWVELESPPAAQASPLPPTRIALHGLAVATSGDYRRAYTHAGRLLQHTLDPHTCAPVAHGLSAVSVIHPACMQADAWATAIMVRGPQEGLALAERHGLAALLRWRDGAGHWQEACSRAFTALIG